MHVDVAGLGDHHLAHAGAEQAGGPAAAAGADQHLGGVDPAGEVQQAGGDVGGHDGVEGPAQPGGGGAQLLQLDGRDPGQPVAAGDVDRHPLPAGAARGDPGGAPQQRRRLLQPGHRHHHALAGGPGGVDPVGAAVAVEALVHPVGEPQQGELAQGREVALAEVVGERVLDLLRRVDVPVGHPLLQRLRAHVDELDGGGPDHRVGDGLALPDAGDGLHHVVQRLQVLHVQGAHHVDAGGEEHLHVLPALGVRARVARRWSCRSVGVGQLVHEATWGRRASTASRSISVVSTPR